MQSQAHPAAPIQQSHQSELDGLLRWCNSLSGKMSKADKVSKITEIFNNNKLPAAVREWKVDDEEKLSRLMTAKFELADTAFGRK